MSFSNHQSTYREKKEEMYILHSGLLSRIRVRSGRVGSHNSYYINKIKISCSIYIYFPLISYLFVNMPVAFLTLVTMILSCNLKIVVDFSGFRSYNYSSGNATFYKSPYTRKYCLLTMKIVLNTNY